MCSFPTTAVGRSWIGGWRYGAFYQFDSESRPDTRIIDTGTPPPFTPGWKTKMVFPDGSPHEIIPASGNPVTGGYYDTYPGKTVEPSEWYSVDGTYFRLSYNPNGTLNRDNDTWTIHFANGTKVHRASGVQTTTDRNGSFYTAQEIVESDNDRVILIKDQFNREIRIEKPVSGPHLVKVKSVGGADLTTTINWGTTKARGKKYEAWSGDQPIVRTLNPTLDVVKSIVLPNGSKYSFDYNSDTIDPVDATKSLGWGELSKVTLPTGAFAEYGYANDGVHGGSDTEIIEILSNRTGQKKLTYEETYGGQTQTRTETWFYGADVDPDPPIQPATILNPDGSWVHIAKRYMFENQESVELAEKIKSSDGTITERWFKQNRPPAITDGKQNRIVTHEFITIPAAPVPPNTIGQPSLTALKEFEYDWNGNVTKTKVYDYIPYGSFTKTTFNSEVFITGLPADVLSKLKITTETAYCNPGNIYSSGSAPAILGAPQFTEVRDSAGALISRTETFYDGFTSLGYISAGNPTLVKTYSSHRTGTFQPITAPLNDNNSVSVKTEYDQWGNVRKVWDASGDETRFVETIYDSTYNLFPIKVITPAPATDPNDPHSINLTTEVTTAFDFHTGLLTSVTDEFNQTTTTQYDTYGRPIRVYAANFTAPETVSAYGVPNASGILTADQRFVRVGKQIDATNWDEATTWTDGMGRAIKTQAKDSQGDVFVETHYDNMGRVDRVTNPYRVGDTVYWSKTRYDIAGRAVETYAPIELANLANAQSLGTTSFDISTVPNFVGTVVTTTDASLRKGRSITNALGQLLRVDEPTGIGGTADADLGTLANPLQPTFYNYSPQGKMVRVQQGVQNRYFLYDSLGRLLRVRQPEQEVNTSLGLSDPITGNSAWTAGFTYDVLGNVLTATDANGTVITNTYDRAGRVKTRSYNDGLTSAVNFYYDGKGLAQTQNPNFAKGKLTKVDNGMSATEYMTFDNFGRLTRSRQVTDGVVYGDDSHPITYTYNLSGALVQETYPSGRVVKNDFESDGDIARIFGKATPTATERTYATAFSYTPDGRIARLRLGNGLWEAAKFNTRLQVTELALGRGVASGEIWKLGYEYGELNAIDGAVDSTKNTGNVARQILSFNGLTQPFVQSYRYDALYRLTEARETSGTGTSEPQTWRETFGYDIYGNRTAHDKFHGTTQTVESNITDPTIDLNTNRFNTGQGYLFDKNGNLVEDAQDRTFVFNGDNKQKEVRDGNNNLVGEYLYDGEGKRVKKKTYVNGVFDEETIFVYSNGKLIAEYSNKPPPAPPVATTKFTITDQLGSPRILVNSLGEVVSRRDFLPFGEEIVPDQTINFRMTNQKYGLLDDRVRQKFTGYQKDAETNLDFAEARMYENRHGRFTAVDPLLASGKSANPQTFNRYVYVMNSPLILVDPSGLQAGTWYEADDGKSPYIYHYPWNKLPSGYSELTRRNGAGELISDPTNRTHVMRFNPNGPATNPRDPTILLTGLKALLYSDYDFKGYDVITSDWWEDTFVEHPADGYVRGSQMAITPLDVALFVSPFRAARAIVPGSGNVPQSRLPALFERCCEIHNALDPIAKAQRTTAIVETQEGFTLVASSQRTLSPVQRSMLAPNEIAVTGVGHAEATALAHAARHSLTPTRVVASRTICSECSTLFLESMKRVDPFLRFPQ